VCRGEKVIGNHEPFKIGALGISPDLLHLLYFHKTYAQSSDDSANILVSVEVCLWISQPYKHFLSRVCSLHHYRFDGAEEDGTVYRFYPVDHPLAVSAHDAHVAELEERVRNISAELSRLKRNV
jgi:hypothetical protein